MRCGDCRDTGYVVRGMVVTPLGADDFVDYVANLIACSHPNASETTVSGEPTLSRTVAVGAVGHGREAGGHAGASEAGPPASHDDGDIVIHDPLSSPDPRLRAEAWRVHDERVAADAAAYEQRHGGGS